jgi:Na+/H+ antiporter NhaC
MKRFGKICLMIVLFSLVGVVIGNFFEIPQSVQMISGFIMGVVVASVVKK